MLKRKEGWSKLKLAEQDFSVYVREITQKQTEAVCDRISELQAEQRQLRRELKELEDLQQSSVNPKQIEEELASIAALRGVRVVQITKESLVFECQVRVPHKGQLYDFGNYKITIGGARLLFYAERTRSGVRDGMEHDYPDYAWGSDYGFCFGDELERDILLAIKEGCFNNAAEMIVSALHAVNDNGHRENIPDVFKEGTPAKYGRGVKAPIKKSSSLKRHMEWRREFLSQFAQRVLLEKWSDIRDIDEELEELQERYDELTSTGSLYGELKLEGTCEENLMAIEPTSDGFRLKIRPIITYENKRYALGDYTINMGSACNRARYVEILGPTIRELRGRRDTEGLRDFSMFWCSYVGRGDYLSILPEVVADLLYIPIDNLRLIPQYLEPYEGR